MVMSINGGFVSPVLVCSLLLRVVRRVEVLLLSDCSFSPLLPLLLESSYRYSRTLAELPLVFVMFVEGDVNIRVGSIQLCLNQNQGRAAGRLGRGGEARLCCELTSCPLEEDKIWTNNGCMLNTKLSTSY